MVGRVDEGGCPRGAQLLRRRQRRPTRRLHPVGHPHVVDAVLALPRRTLGGRRLGRPDLPCGEEAVAHGQRRPERERVRGGLPVAERLVASRGVRRGVEVPRDDERDGSGGKAAGVLVPRSEPGHLVKELLGLCEKKTANGGHGGSRFRGRKLSVSREVVRIVWRERGYVPGIAFSASG